MWAPRYIWPTERVVVSRGEGNKGTTMGGLDILPHGHFPLHVPVLILEFGSQGGETMQGVGGEIGLVCRIIFGWCSDKGSKGSHINREGTFRQM